MITSTSIRVGFSNTATIPIQANTIINQNDIFDTTTITLEYNPDNTLKQDLIVDDILLINTTRQEYLSLQNTNTHTETTGMTQHITTSGKSKISLNLTTNKLNIQLTSLNILDSHTWSNSDDYRLIIKQEDNTIDFNFKSKQ